MQKLQSQSIKSLSAFQQAQISLQIAFTRFLEKNLSFIRKMKTILVFYALIAVSISKDISQDSQTIKNCLKVTYLILH